MATNLTFRRAKPEDLYSLAEFGTALAAQHNEYDASRFLTPSRATFHSFFAQELANPDSIILIVEEGGKPLGYAFLRWESPSIVDLTGRSLWLHDLYLHPSARGRGVGAALLQNALSLARQAGAAKVLLKASPKNHHALIAFEKAGFRITMREMQIDL
jgi:GNAT superfamily N-acetyltransferase